MWTFLETNTRDKMLILALVWLGTLDMIIVAILCWHGKFTEAIAIFALAMSIGGTLAGAYKGNPSPPEPSPTAVTTSTIKTESSETVSDKGEKSAT